MAVKTFYRKMPGGYTVVTEKSYTPGDVFYVDSGNANGSDQAGFGVNTDNPFATLDYAIGQCTADNGDVIIVLPGHTEDLGAAAKVDCDVAGITIMGLGQGSDRPRIDLDATDAGVLVGASNIHIENITIRPSVNNVVIGMDIEAGITGTKIESCEWMIGETAATDECLIHIDIKAACHDTRITNCLFRSDDGSAPAVGIKLTGASHRAMIRNNTFMGPFSTAAVNGITALSEDILIADNFMKVADGEPGIELFTGTTGMIINNIMDSTGIVADSAIVADACGWILNFVATADGGAYAVVGTQSA